MEKVHDETIYSIAEINHRYKACSNVSELIDLLIYEHSQIYRYKIHSYNCELLIYNTAYFPKYDDINKIELISDTKIITVCDNCGKRETRCKLTPDQIKQGYVKNTNHILFRFTTYQ